MAAEKKDSGNSNSIAVQQPEDKQKVVRVAPYPIDCLLVKGEGQPLIPCKVIRVEDFGLMFKAVKHFFRPGDEYKCDFELPLFKTKIHEQIKIIKTYENMEPFVPKGNKERVMTVEAHFKSLSPEAKQSIRNFILKIKQKKI